MGAVHGPGTHVGTACIGVLRGPRSSHGVTGPGGLHPQARVRRGWWCWCGPAAPSSPRGAQGLCPAHGGLGCDVKILQPPAILHFAELFLFNACYKPPVSPRGDSNQWHPVPPNPCGKEPLPPAWGHPSTTPHPPPPLQTQLPRSGQILSRVSSMAAEATPWEKVLAAGSRPQCCRHQPLALPR